MLLVLNISQHRLEILAIRLILLVHILKTILTGTRILSVLRQARQVKMELQFFAVNGKQIVLTGITFCKIRQLMLLLSRRRTGCISDLSAMGIQTVMLRPGQDLMKVHLIFTGITNTSTIWIFTDTIQTLAYLLSLVSVRNSEYII